MFIISVKKRALTVIIYPAKWNELIFQRCTGINRVFTVDKKKNFKSYTYITHLHYSRDITKAYNMMTRFRTRAITNSLVTYILICFYKLIVTIASAQYHTSYPYTKDKADNDGAVLLFSIVC